MSDFSRIAAYAEQAGINDILRASNKRAEERTALSPQMFYILEMKIKCLEAENAVLRKEISDMGWTINPDRMGGAYSQDEINNAYAWK